MYKLIIIYTTGRRVEKLFSSYSSASAYVYGEGDHVADYEIRPVAE